MREFLGTVPKKWQLVETFWDCPEISESNKLQFNNQKGKTNEDNVYMYREYL